MRAVTWKSGASAPRKASTINAGFSPRGRTLLSSAFSAHVGTGAFARQPSEARHPCKKIRIKRFVLRIRIRVFLQAYRKRPIINCALRRCDSIIAHNKTGVPTPCGGNAGSPFPHGDGGREDLRSESVVPDLDLHPAPPPALICQPDVKSLSKGIDPFPS